MCVYPVWAWSRGLLLCAGAYVHAYACIGTFICVGHTCGSCARALMPTVQENNVLFGWAAQRLGFDVTTVSAAVHGSGIVVDGGTIGTVLLCMCVHVCACVCMGVHGCACGVHAVCMRCACGVHAVCMRCACGVHGCAWERMGAHGCAWERMGVRGCAWVCMRATL